MVDRLQSARRSSVDESDARARLEAERTRLAGLIAVLEEVGFDREPEADSIGEIASAGQHPADVGLETFERERQLSMLEDFREELGGIEAALGRLADGSYGICAGCRRPIDPDRLAAVPATRYCRPCQERYELGGALLAEPAQPTHGTVADVAEFLPDDDLEPPSGEPTVGPEEGAVVAHPDTELSGVELQDELVAEGVCEDELRSGEVMVALSEEDIDDTLEWETDEAEEASLEERREEEVLDEEGVPDEEQEADLAVAIRRQLGLEKEELEEVPAELADVEQLPRPRRPDEFLCSTCFQLKLRTQLADPAGSRCIDCVNNSAR